MEGFGASESRYCPGDRRRLNLPASPRVRVNVRRALRPGSSLVVGLMLSAAIVTSCGSAVAPTPSAPSSSPGSVSPSAAPASALVSASPDAGAARITGWQSDLDGLLPAMEKLHPDLYHGTSKAMMAAAVQTLRDSVPTASDDVLLVGLIRIVSMVSAKGGDGHTGAYIWGDGEPPYHSLPLRLWLFPEGVYVVGADPAHRDLVGSRIVSIDAHPIADVLAALDPLIPRDTAQTVKLLTPRFLLIPEALDGLGLRAATSTVAVEVADAAGKARTVPLEPERMADYNLANGAYGLHLPPDFEPLYLSNTETPLWSSRIDGGHTLYVGYNRVDGVTAAALTGVKDALADASITKVVVDIRQNYGGQSNGYLPLLDLLKQPSPVAKRQIYVVTGRNTFSAGSLFAVEMDAETKAIFVGEPMGGARTFYANPSTVHLAWSGIELSVATGFYDVGPAGDTRTTIDPEIPAVLHAADYFGHRDPAMEAISALP